MHDVPMGSLGKLLEMLLSIIFRIVEKAFCFLSAPLVARAGRGRSERARTAFLPVGA